MFYGPSWDENVSLFFLETFWNLRLLDFQLKLWAIFFFFSPPPPILVGRVYSTFISESFPSLVFVLFYILDRFNFRLIRICSRTHTAYSSLIYVLCLTQNSILLMIFFSLSCKLNTEVGVKKTPYPPAHPPHSQFSLVKLNTIAEESFFMLSLEIIYFYI